MSIKNSGELLSAYFDGETSPEETAIVERLLESSVGERRALDEVGEISVLLGSLPSQQAPVELAPSVLKRAEREALFPLPPDPVIPPSRSFSRKGIGAGLMTAAAALLLVVYILSRPLHRFADEKPDATQIAQNQNRKTPGEQAETASSNEPTEIAASKNRLSAENLSAGEPATGELQTFSRSEWNHSRLRDVRIGEVIPYFAISDDRVAVLEVTVVDVRQAVGKTQILLERNHIPRSEGKSSQASKLNSTNAGDALNQKGQPETPETSLFAVYVESTEAQLAESLEQLRAGGLLTNLRLRPPVEMNRVELTDGNTLLTRHQLGADQKTGSEPRSDPNAEKPAFQMLVNLQPDSLRGGLRNTYGKPQQAVPKAKELDQAEATENRTPHAPIRLILIFHGFQPVEAPKPE